MGMKTTGTIIFLLLGIVTSTDLVGDGGSNAIISSKKYSTFVDLLKDDLLQQEWDESEQECYEQTLQILTNVQNATLWATWIWDSVQIPSGQFYGTRNYFGNFDQCLRRVWTTQDPVHTQYCLVDIKLADTDPNKRLTNVHGYDNAESYFHVQTVYGLKFNLMSWGVCLPSVCQTGSVDRFIRTLYKLSHFGTVKPNPEITAQHCQISQSPPQNKTGLYLLLLSVLILIIIATVCTYITKKYKETKSHRIVMKIVSAFDLTGNTADLMSVGKDEIKVMHGIRFLTACTVVILHVMFINIMATAGNGLDMNDDFEFYAPLLSHISVVVDTYFMMSGLLLVRSFKPETGRLINPFKLMIKRYFRLIWVFIVMILVMVTVTPFLYGGPLWTKYAKNEKDACEKTWWLGLLMLGNYIDTENICMQTAWYIPADYHLAVASTVMYWLYQKNRRGGLYLFCVVTLVSVLLPGVYTYLHELKAITVFDFETITTSRKHVTGSPIYVFSHFRAGPYIVGLIAGYILSKYKPANYRNILSMKYSIISGIAITSLCLTILILAPRYEFREYNALEVAVFAATNRSIWAALNAAFILLCEYGTLPIIPDFLGWSAFAPLSKLSFGIYMCHYVLVMRLNLALRSPAWHDFYKIMQDSMGILVVASILSLYLTLFIEAPLNNLVALVFKTKASLPKKEKPEKSDTATVKSESFKENTAVDDVRFVSMKREYRKDNTTNVNGMDNRAHTTVNEESTKEGKTYK